MNRPTPSALAAEIKRLVRTYDNRGSSEGYTGAPLRELHDAIDRLAALASAAHGEPVAWHFTDMQSGDVHVDWVEPERDQRDRYWIRPLVYGDTRPAASAEPAEACRHPAIESAIEAMAFLKYRAAIASREQP